MVMASYTVTIHVPICSKREVALARFLTFAANGDVNSDEKIQMAEIGRSRGIPLTASTSESHIRHPCFRAVEI
jgi:hypothetical protein